MKNFTFTKANARIGLVGNPSDGFHGKTISCLISNYWANVRIWRSSKVYLVPNEVFDTNTFEDLKELNSQTQLLGYYGGIRLMRATCKKFFEVVEKSGIKIDTKFSISYNSNIPFGNFLNNLFIYLFI